MVTDEFTPYLSVKNIIVSEKVIRRIMKEEQLVVKKSNELVNIIPIKVKYLQQ